MVILLIVIAAVTLLAGLALGFLARGEIDERSRQRLERARIKLTELHAEHQIHEIATQAFSELLDAARRREP